mmetsp:Transcript_8056/g.23598  ORF Transcript_8056/g.23598 Transcript_8056/m.23598 type:complete len:252 (+) Transcript_8056:928-1683(+)
MPHLDSRRHGDRYASKRSRAGVQLARPRGYGCGPHAAVWYGRCRPCLEVLEASAPGEPARGCPRGFCHGPGCRGGHALHVCAARGPREPLDQGRQQGLRHGASAPPGMGPAAAGGRGTERGGGWPGGEDPAHLPCGSRGPRGQRGRLVCCLRAGARLRRRGRRLPCHRRWHWCQGRGPGLAAPATGRGRLALWGAVGLALVRVALPPRHQERAVACWHTGGRCKGMSGEAAAAWGPDSRPRLLNARHKERG